MSPTRTTTLLGVFATWTAVVLTFPGPLLDACSLGLAAVGPGTGPSLSSLRPCHQSLLPLKDQAPGA